MSEDDRLFSKRNIKLFLWAISSGIIVAFFFASNFLNFAISFSPGSGILLISPLFAGFLLGIMTTNDDVYHSVILSIIMTITAVVLITLVLFMPVINGFWEGWKDLYYLSVMKDITLSIVLIFPVSLTTSVIGKVFGEAILMGSIHKKERSLLREETLEWYQMLEAAIDREKKLKREEEDKKAAKEFLESQIPGKEETNTKIEDESSPGESDKEQSI